MMTDNFALPNLSLAEYVRLQDEIYERMTLERMQRDKENYERDNQDEKDRVRLERAYDKAFKFVESIAFGRRVGEDGEMEADMLLSQLLNMEKGIYTVRSIGTIGNPIDKSVLSKTNRNCIWVYIQTDSNSFAPYTEEVDYHKVASDVPLIFGSPISMNEYGEIIKREVLDWVKA